MEIQKSMNINRNLIKLTLFVGANTSYLHICMHHFIVDNVSWRIIVEDINYIYDLINSGEIVKLPEKTTSFIEWNECCAKLSGEGFFNKEIPY